MTPITGRPMPVLAKVYAGDSLERATEAYQRDAQVLARDGYHPAAQSWQPPTTRNGTAVVGVLVLAVSWLIALSMPYGRAGAAAFGPLLIFGGTGLGIVLIIGALPMKRPGGLTVTYQLTSPPERGSPMSPSGQLAPYTPGTGASLANRLAQLDEARKAGLITEDEFQARRNAVIAGI